MQSIPVPVGYTWLHSIFLVPILHYLWYLFYADAFNVESRELSRRCEHSRLTWLFPLSAILVLCSGSSLPWSQGYCPLARSWPCGLHAGACFYQTLVRLCDGVWRVSRANNLHDILHTNGTNGNMFSFMGVPEIQKCSHSSIIQNLNFTHIHNFQASKSETKSSPCSGGAELQSRGKKSDPNQKRGTCQKGRGCLEQPPGICQRTSHSSW